MIVSTGGNLEYAEWITGGDGRFVHRDDTIDKERLRELERFLAELGQGEHAIGFDKIDCDLDEYQRNPRTLLRFWYQGEPAHAFAPVTTFYSEFGISTDRKEKFEQAFDGVLSLLPCEWISAADTQFEI